MINFFKKLVVSNLKKVERFKKNYLLLPVPLIDLTTTS